MRTMTLSKPRRATPRGGFALALLAAAALLCSCNPKGGPSGPDLKLGAPSAGPASSQPLAPPAGEPSELIGQGPIKIALIVPLTQASGPSSVGASLRNAAQLAYLESGQNEVSIVVKDDHSSPAGAAAAAQAAVNEGAELIIGPVFAAGVKEAGRVAKGAGKPVIAFSTNSSAASRGVYLLSFLVEGNVERIIDFAAQRGKKSAAALVPDNDYGALALAQFQQSAANHGLRVVVIEKYKPGQPADSVKRIAAVADQIDMLFIPEFAGRDRRPGARADRRQYQLQTPADPGHEPLERPARAEASCAAGRLVRGAGEHRLQRLCGQISRQIWVRAVAHRDPRL